MSVTNTETEQEHVCAIACRRRGVVVGGAGVCVFWGGAVIQRPLGEGGSSPVRRDSQPGVISGGASKPVCIQEGVDW
jgi:hypothetical protein